MDRFTTHDKQYSEVFYSELASSSDLSAERLVPILIEKFKPSSVVDIGCGSGAFCRAFIANGIKDVVGVEGPWISKIESHQSWEWLRIHNLESPLNLRERFDLAICLEVAEHIPELHAEILIDSLVRVSDRIVFSAALPGQNGTNHINLQFPEYWARLFATKGYFLESDFRHEIWNIRGIAPWYKQNLLVFHKKNEEIYSYVIPQVIFHPDIFPELHSIAYRVYSKWIRAMKRLRRIIIREKNRHEK